MICLHHKTGRHVHAIEYIDFTSIGDFVHSFGENPDDFFELNVPDNWVSIKTDKGNVAIDRGDYVVRLNPGVYRVVSAERFDNGYSLIIDDIYPRVVLASRTVGSSLMTIQNSAWSKLPIICESAFVRKNLIQMANENKLSIPKPITIDEVMLRKIDGEEIKAVIVHDAHRILRTLIDKPISLISITTK